MAKLGSRPILGFELGHGHKALSTFKTSAIFLVVFWMLLSTTSWTIAVHFVLERSKKIQHIFAQCCVNKEGATVFRTEFFKESFSSSTITRRGLSSDSSCDSLLISFLKPRFCYFRSGSDPFTSSLIASWSNLCKIRCNKLEWLLDYGADVQSILFQVFL